MFEIITGAKPGQEPSQQTRQAVIRTGLYQLTYGLRELPIVMPELTQVQRNQVRLALCEAIGELDRCDVKADGILRLTGARA